MYQSLNAERLRGPPRHTGHMTVKKLILVAVLVVAFAAAALFVQGVPRCTDRSPKGPTVGDAFLSAGCQNN